MMVCRQYDAKQSYVSKKEEQVTIALQKIYCNKHFIDNKH